uniref:P-type domain-containing protein n=1 Tax=Spermophilus dauricus TaxID=99837 RepID=A0A8C9PXA0_SPEDA
MEARALWLLLLVLALGSSGWAEQDVGQLESQCVFPAKERVNCGYLDIDREACTNRGCCFDSSIRGVPWCFKPLQETGKLTFEAIFCKPSTQGPCHL